MNLVEIAENPELIEVARKAIENDLVELREARISIMGRSNGLVIKEKNGEDSTMIRLPIETAMKIGLEAIAKHIETIVKEYKPSCFGMPVNPGDVCIQTCEYATACVKDTKTIRFIVLDNYKPAKNPEHKVGDCWDKCIYDTFEEAHEYAMKWLGQYAPVGKLELGVPYHYSGYDDKLVIEEIEA